MGFSFEKLDVYKNAIDFACNIYEITKKFPKNETYGLTSQLRRASVSISSNIAEGSGRYNKRDFAQYLRIARGSIYECIPLLEISFRESYINKSLPQHFILNKL